MRLFRLFWGLFLLMPITVFGQGYIDLLTVNSYHSPETKVEGSEERIAVRQDYFGTRMPLLRDNEDVVLLSPYYTRLKLTTSTPFTRDEAFFHQVGLPIGYQRHFSDKFQLLAMAIPRLSSDLKDVSGADFLYGGLLLLTHKKRPGLSYKYGFYYGQEFFGPMIVPIFGIDWKINQKWRFFGNLPIRATLQYKLHPRIATGLNFIANVTSFRMSEERQGIYLHKSTNELYWFADWYLTKKIVLRTEIGRTILRSFRTFARNDQLDTSISLLKFGERKQLNRDLEDGNVFGVSLIYRFPIEKKE